AAREPPRRPDVPGRPPGSGAGSSSIPQEPPLEFSAQLPGAGPVHAERTPSPATDESIDVLRSLHLGSSDSGGRRDDRTPDRNPRAVAQGAPGAARAREGADPQKRRAGARAPAAAV